jgi:plastocyanin
MTGQQPPLAGISPRASAHASASTVTVAIINYAYFPPAITIKAGTTIKFVNHDVVEHTVTAKSGAFNSPLIGPGVTWKHTFKRAGLTYHYYCQVHPSMTGIVKVTK